MKLSAEKLQESFDIIRNVVVSVFQYERHFREAVLFGKISGWYVDDYVIERLHMANQTRITLVHFDGRQKDIYIDSQDVLDWWLDLQDKLLGGEQ